jgi:uncharacterized membrane protein YphA (DoxX/SURF4 family)/peroxiredoxin
MAVLLLGARIALALVFAVAGFTKLRDRPGTEKAVTEFGAPLKFAKPIATLLPFAEFTAALLLLLSKTAWVGSLAALALLLIFTIAISYNLWKGRRPACNCFGQLSSAPIGRSTLVRNGILLLLAGFVAWTGPDQPGLQRVALSTGLSLWPLVAILFGLIAIAMLALQSWFLLNLMRQNGRLLQRIEAMEVGLKAGQVQPAVFSNTAPALGLPVGSPAPAFSLPQLDATPLSLDTLRSDGRSVLLLFSDPNCGPCNALMPTAALWQQQYSSLLRIIIISVGPLETNRAKQQEYRLAEVLLQKDREVANMYQAYGTPSAVLVRPDGTIGSAVAPGAEAISALVSSATNGSREHAFNLLATSEPSTTGNDLSGSEADTEDPFPWFNKVEFWFGPLEFDGQQSNVRLVLHEECGTVSGQAYAVDPLNGQAVQMGEITGTRTGNSLSLVTNTNLQITADLTANGLTGQIVFPESYGAAGITSQFTLTPIFASFLPRLLQERQ